MSQKSKSITCSQPVTFVTNNKYINFDVTVHSFPGNYNPRRQNLPVNQDFEVLISSCLNFPLHRTTALFIYLFFECG